MLRGLTCVGQTMANLGLTHVGNSLVLAMVVVVVVVAVAEAVVWLVLVTSNH